MRPDCQGSRTLPCRHKKRRVSPPFGLRWFEPSVGLSQKHAVVDQAGTGNPLAVHIEQTVEPARVDSRGNGSLNLGPVDANRNRGSLVGFGGLLNGLSFHLLQTVDEGLGLADGERGHGVVDGGGVAPELPNFSTSGADPDGSRGR